MEYPFDSQVHSNSIWQYLRGPIYSLNKSVMANILDCSLKVSEFKLQSHSDIHFWANTPGKGMNSLILPAMV